MSDSMLANITAPYTRLEAWAYDRFIAPAVAQLRGQVESELLEGLAPGASLLDVGCGGGHNLESLAQSRPDVQLTGLDLAPGQVARARRRTAGSGASIVEGSALDLPFVDRIFDCVMSVGSIKHWPDPARGLSECVRVLKPGGSLMIVEADRGCTFDDAMAFVAHWSVPSTLRHVTVGFYLTYVAGRSLDLLEAGELMAQQPFAERRVERLPGLPALMMQGTQAHAAGYGVARH